MMSSRSENSSHSSEVEDRAMSDDFIESVITPNPQSKEEAMNREFYSMMAVQADERDESEDGGDNE